jgi:HEAT repeat protein
LTGNAEIALAIAVVFGGIVALLLAYLGFRRVVETFLMKRLAGRVQRIDDVLGRHRQEQFRSLDRLLFQLGDVHDMPAVEAALNRVLPSAAVEERDRLIQVYRSLGIVERYIRDLREAGSRAVRTSAAHSLGYLQVVEAIPALVAAMRDPHEDAQTVKMAAAQALGRMQAAEAISLMLAELQTRDNWASPRIAELLVSFGPRAVPALIDALGDESSANMRVWAAQILGRIGVVSAEAPLVQRLRDRSEQVRMSAAEALGNLRLPQSTRELMHLALHDPVGPVRAEAARALGRIGDESSLDALLALLSDPDFWTRMRVIEAIELIRPRDPSSLEALLHDTAVEVRQRAAVALDRIGVVTRRAEELAGDDRGLRGRAHRFLVDVGRAGLMESLLALLEHADLKVRSRMADVLGDVRDPRAVVPLTERLGDTAWPVRVRAIEALARLAPEDGPERVMPALSDPEDTVRAAAIHALKSMGLSRDLPGLDKVLEWFDGPNVEIRAGVVEAVGHLALAEVDDVLCRALQDPSVEVRLPAVRAVGTRGQEIWLPRIQDHLGDPDGRVRLATVVALGRIGTPRAVEALLPHLDSPDRALREVLTNELAEQGSTVTRWLHDLAPVKEVQVAKAWLLGKVGDPEVLPDLRALAASPDAEVRAATAGALAKLDHEQSREILEPLARDRNPRVRAAAVNALGRIGTPGMLAGLEETLSDPDAFVRNRAALAIGRIGEPAALEILVRHDGRSSDPSFQDHLAVAYGLCGGSRGFSQAVAALSDARRQPRIQAILDSEPAEVRQRFYRNLDLVRDNRGDGLLSADDLAQHCASILRTHQDPQARVAAVASLRSLDLGIHRDLLADAVMTDPAPEVRARALETLADLLPDTPLNDLFAKALRDPVVSVQIQAARGLSRLSSPDCNVELLRAFLAGDPDLDEVIVSTLRHLNAGSLDRFVDDLMGFCEEPVLRGGMLILGRMGDPGATRLLTKWLTSRNPVLRASAARALGEIAAPESVETLKGALQDPIEDVRVAAVTGLGDATTMQVPDILAPVARDPSRWVRRTLARVTAGRMDVSWIPLLEQLADDHDEDVRVDALLGLVALPGPDMPLRFLERLADQPRTVSQPLRWTRSDHPAVTRLISHVDGDRRPEVRAASLECLAALGQTPAPTLLAAMKDPSPAVRAKAVSVLAPTAPADVRKAAQRMISDPDPSVRRAVSDWMNGASGAALNEQDPNDTTINQLPEIRDDD